MNSNQITIDILYAEEHVRLKRRFLRRGMSEHTASDMVQETFIRLLRVPKDEIRNLRAYLYRTADSVAIDKYRADFRARKVMMPDAISEELIADPQPSIEAEIIAREELAALNSAILELPPRCREVLILHKFEGLTYAKISLRLGISRNTVMVHMVKALGSLRKRLKENNVGSG